MNLPMQHRKTACAALAATVALAAIVALASCGGGGVVGSGGTGRAGGSTVGTVNGFGSVIVDGVSYDDRSATTVREVEPGMNVIAEVKLGHRVSLEYQSAGVASVVRIDAALAGPVASVGPLNQLQVLGQSVTINASAATGPVTQFGGGYTQSADVHAGDWVEVHGMLVRASGSTAVQATRIDKLAALPAYLRVSGVVGQLGSIGAMKMTLGALTVDTTSAMLLPAGVALANGQVVTVLALPGTLSTAAAGSLQIQAAQVRVRDYRAGTLDDYVSGAVANLDTQAKTLTLDGLPINYSTAIVTPAATPLANGRYVRVRGQIAADGVFVATSLVIRDGTSDSEAELRGDVSLYDSVSKSFTVRDVRVDASNALLEGCPVTGLSNGLFVEIMGALSSTGVVAQTVQCESEPVGGTIEREGVAGSVDLTAKSFSLTLEHGTVVGVKWTDTTFFGGVTPLTLNGKSVHIEGALVDGVFVANKVKIGD